MSKKFHHIVIIILNPSKGMLISLHARYIVGKTGNNKDFVIFQSWGARKKNFVFQMFLGIRTTIPQI